MGNIYFDNKHHEFELNNHSNLNFENVSAPLSVILQVTRKCNFDCQFCSESEFFEDPKIFVLENLISKLRGVQRLYLSGGEPILRKDIFEIIDLFRPHFPILGLPTNSSLINKEVGKKLIGKINYINAGLDGPRKINNIVRGSYDKIIEGLLVLKELGIEVSLSSVILKSTLPYLDYVVQIADNLNVVKVKLVIPVLRGKAKSIPESNFADKNAILQKFEQLKKFKTELGWKPRLKFTFWDKSTEGYAIIIYPNLKVYAWPVFSAPDSALYIGDLTVERLSGIWNKYPFKNNHIKKYTGLSMYKA